MSNVGPKNAPGKSDSLELREGRKKRLNCILTLRGRDSEDGQLLVHFFCVYRADGLGHRGRLYQIKRKLVTADEISTYGFGRG
jgi:hypothetical protein